MMAMHATRYCDYVNASPWIIYCDTKGLKMPALMSDYFHLPAFARHHCAATSATTMISFMKCMPVAKMLSFCEKLLARVETECSRLTEWNLENASLWAIPSFG